MANESEPRIRYGEATMRRGRNPVRRVPDQKIDGTPRLPELGSPVYHPKARAIVPGRGALLKVFLKREVISNWSNWVKFDLSPYANVASYRERIGRRIAVRAALEAEGLIPWPSSPP